MAVGDVYSEIGGTRKVCLGKPATEDQVGYAALTWTTIKGVTQMPARGDTRQDNAEATLDQGRVYHNPGQTDGGVLNIPMIHIEGDAGQAILRAAEGTGGTISWQETDPDGKAYFFHGKVMSMQRRETTPTSNKGWICMFGVNSPRFEGTPDAT